MKEEREETKGIVVLDEGIEMDAVVLSACCGSVLIPFRS